jgi:hypothetical protein
MPYWTQRVGGRPPNSGEITRLAPLGWILTWAVITIGAVLLVAFAVKCCI